MQLMYFLYPDIENSFHIKITNPAHSDNSIDLIKTCPNLLNFYSVNFNTGFPTFMRFYLNTARWYNLGLFFYAQGKVMHEIERVT